MLCEGENFITEPQYVAEIMNHGFTTVSAHIDDGTPMVKNGDITMQDIVKHYENHPSVVKIKEFVQSRSSIGYFEYTYITVEKNL